MTISPILTFPPAPGSANHLAASILSFDVANVTALTALSTSQYSHANTLGYYSPGDGGADAYFSVASGGPDVFGDIAASDGGVWRRVFQGRVNSKQLGLLGDGNQSGTIGTDQTTLVQSILNSLPSYTTLEFLPGYYNVSSIDFGSNINNCTFIFYDAWFSGIAMTAHDAIVRLYGVNNCKFYNLALVSDGAAPTVVHQGNYGTALQFKGDNVTNTCFNYFYGINIRYIKAGITYGSLLGEAMQIASELSENWIYGFEVRGVLQPFYGNAFNAYLKFTDSNLVAQQFESNRSWWNDAAGFCARNDPPSTGFYGGNQVVFEGCEFQRALIAGYAIIGGNMVIRAPCWEVACPVLQTGDITISDNVDGFFGPSGVVPFIVQAGTVAQLVLDRFKLGRPAGTASFDRSRLVDATGSISHKVVLQDCELLEWYFDGSEAAATLVHGCQATLKRVTISNSSTTSWYLDDQANRINNVDRSGMSLPIAGTTGSFGGWLVTAGAANGAYHQFTGDAPFGLGQCIRVITIGAGFNFATDTVTRFKVDGQRDYHFFMPLKFGTTASTAYLAPFIDWYEYGGTLISSSALGQLDQPNAPAAGFNSWLLFRSVVKAPVNAYTAVLRFIFGTSSTILFCLPSLV